MLVGSYFGEREQFVRSGGQESSVGAVTCEVPQGSVRGPLLFISYIEGYQVLPFSHLCACSANLSHLCWVELLKVY
jgi:hypothetical protein